MYGVGYSLWVRAPRASVYITPPEKGCRCKHIAAVEHTLFISSEAALGKKVDIMKQHMVCPHCKKEGYTGDGWYYSKHEKR